MVAPGLPTVSLRPLTCFTWPAARYSPPTRTHASRSDRTCGAGRLFVLCRQQLCGSAYATMHLIYIDLQKQGV